MNKRLLQIWLLVFGNKLARGLWRLRRLASATVLVIAVAVPQSVRAHGELLIRIAAVTRQIEAATNNLAALYLERGELHREHRSWEAAGSDYARAAQLAPSLTAVDFCRAMMLADSGQLDAARAMFDKVLARCPTDGEAFIGRARVLVKLGQHKPAAADFRHGLELLSEPKPDYFLELAQALVEQGQADEALRSLDEGMKRFGSIVTLQSYALDLELRRKNNDAALARLDTILERSERKENWFARRGDILLAAGRLAEARKSLEAALAAVHTLPLRLQQGPAMLKLQSRVNAALAGMTNAPSVGNVDWELSAKEGR